MRTYDFKLAGKEMNYALFVPSTYDKEKKSPLIVALHGLVNIRVTGSYRYLPFPQILCDLSVFFRFCGTSASCAAWDVAYYS